MSVTKIGTCCYCGTKAALVLRGKDRHELSCASCGAPLHVLKSLPAREVAPQPRMAVSHRPAPINHAAPARPGKRKKRKSFKRKVWSEVWDALEDIFD